MSFVNTVDLIGDEALTNSIIDRSITEINDDVATKLGYYSFQHCKNLVNVHFLSVTDIGIASFRYCSSLRKAIFPSASNLGMYSFQGCSSLEFVDIGGGIHIGGDTLDYNASLATLILRSTTMCTLGRNLSGTPIASGTGYIYVPRALVDTYKSATNWSTYAAQFRALEDYTVDGTTTGELDETKI